ncbi:MAG TPA: carbonic anhydrase [Balneolales bacterium]|nr:carbonic anhydrase [Balneolales bacterium]
MSSLKDLFKKNEDWSQRIKEQDPHFFEHSAEGQNPEYLWITCSDSRVPVNQIVQAMPGDIFVHRNIANLILQTDINSLSVIQYAVEMLKVKHIVVCGHYGCGGVAAALKDQGYGLFEQWIQNIREIYYQHKESIDLIKEEPDRINRLVELNVEEQVHHVCQTTFVKEAWKNGMDLTIHGIVYDLSSGTLKDLNIHKNGNV